MPKEIVGKIPEFTDPGTPDGEKGAEEVKQALENKPEKKEKETQSELPSDEKPTDIAEGDEPDVEVGDDAGQIQELKNQVLGLATEKEKLLTQIQGLRGTRREIKEEKLKKVEEQIDELKGVHPDDVKVIEKIARSKGFISKGEVEKMLSKNIKDSELDKFLSKHPEYKPENDPNNINWDALTKELQDYRMPKNPLETMRILEKAHGQVSPQSRELPSLTAKKKRLETAGVGAGGVASSSSKKPLPAWMKQELSRGGWSEEEIKEIASKYK